tara:strand:+ start:785 stop:1024 length:240 start_codon:yes stop_codon:yes gene_type:complete
MIQLEISAPEYKEELLAELKSRLGRNAVPQVAAKCSYSHSYVRAWFKNPKVNHSIKKAALSLLEEIKKDEAKSLEIVNQ